MSRLLGKYYLAPVIRKLKERNLKNKDIADITGCSIRYLNSLSKIEVSQENNVDKLFGCPDDEFLRVRAVFRCKEIFSGRGWQVGETDPKCIYDVFAIKGKKLAKTQVRSSSKCSKNGVPIFKTGRILFNTKRVIRTHFNKKDFDYWFFYYHNGDCWIIPFDEITTTGEIRMIGYDQFFVNHG